MNQLYVPLGWPSFVRPLSTCALAVAILLAVSIAPCARSQQSDESSAAQPAAIDARDSHGLTQLIVAASAGQTDAVRSLLAGGASLEATSADGRTALIAAAQNGQLDSVKALIAAGADLNRASRGTGTALNVAENKGETEIAALLLASGARSTGKSVGDTVCVRPWAGAGFCGTVKSFTVPSVAIQITRILGCANGCQARQDCSAGQIVGGSNGIQTGDQVAVPSWCLTETGVKP
jgi:ankyrin repeat protein